MVAGRAVVQAAVADSAPAAAWAPAVAAMRGNRAGGEIASIDGNQIKVQSRRGDRVIVVNDQTTFNKEGQAITLKDLKVGDRIFAIGKEANGQFVATEVRSGRPGGGRGDFQGPAQN